MTRKPQSEKTKRTWKVKPVSVFGKVFPSATAASRAVGVATTALRKRLNDPKATDVCFLEGRQEVTSDVNEQWFRQRAMEFRESLFRKVSVFGRVFSSAQRAIEDTGIASSVLRRRLHDPDCREFRYLDAGQEIQQGPSDRQFRELVGAFREAVSNPSVSVFGRAFPSVSHAARESGIPHRVIRKMLRNPGNREFRYCEGKRRGGVSERQFREKTAALLESLPKRPLSVSVFGKVYQSTRQASRETGIPLGTLRNRLRSENFPEYRYLDKPSK